MFRKDDLEVIEIGTLALRLQCITFPFSSWIVVSNMLLQTIGKGTRASVLSLARQGLFFLPAILALPRIWGLLGIQLSQPAADIATFILAIPMGVSIIRELKGLQKEQEMQAEGEEQDG